jgi:hypothetical protein
MSAKFAYAAVAVLLAVAGSAIDAAHSVDTGNLAIAQYRIVPDPFGGPANNRDRNRSLDWFYDHAKGPVA